MVRNHMLNEEPKCQTAGDARGKVKGSQKSVGYIIEEIANVGTKYH